MHITDPLLNIRSESAQDMNFLARLYSSTREDLLQIGLPVAMLDNMIAMQFHAQRSGYRTQFPDADYSIIEQNGEPIGWLVTDRSDDTFRLINIALLQDERNKGYGRCLIKALQAEAAAVKKPLALSVSRLNAHAQHLYSSSGFRVINNEGANLEMVWHPPEILAAQANDS